MAVKIGQIRWFGENSSLNFPADITRAKLRYGTVLPSNYSIVAIGIQTLPGVQCYINAGTQTINIGHTGIFQLDLQGLTTISDITFTNDSLDLIRNSQTGYLIIDYVYYDGSE